MNFAWLLTFQKSSLGEGKQTFVSPTRYGTTDAAGIQRGRLGSLPMKTCFTCSRSPELFILLSRVTTPSGSHGFPPLMRGSKFITSPGTKTHRRSEPVSEVLMWRTNNSNASEYSDPHLIRLEALSLHAVLPEGQDAVLKAHCHRTKVSRRLRRSLNTF